MDLSVLTVSGKTLGENLERVKVLDREVIRLLKGSIHEEGGIEVLRGNLAPVVSSGEAEWGKAEDDGSRRAGPRFPLCGGCGPMSDEGRGGKGRLSSSCHMRDPRGDPGCERCI